MMEEIFLKSALRQFRLYKNLGDKTLARLNPEQLNFVPDPESNSIAVIIQHLHGNMLSRWTDFLTSDGEKPWRQRDGEFEQHKFTKEDLLVKWEEGWTVLFKTLESFHSIDLMKTVVIRKEEMSALEAINRQIAHYAYHVGQIVYLGKMMLGVKWESISMPKNSKPPNKN